ncbi:MAG: XRE family transcriptional regulator [Gammaproteobacteria bacterium]
MPRTSVTRATKPAVKAPVRKETVKAPPPAEPEKVPGPDLALRLTEIRASRGLTLREMQALTGIPTSTLSKVQNRQATLSYEALVRLAAGLEIEVSDLFVSRTLDVKAGRRVITRRGTGPNEATDRYAFELLCSDLINKQMNPAILEITARSLREAGGLAHHDGEEFIYVLAGTVEIHTEDYRPTRLEQGDALYLDSTSGHAYVNIGKDAARVLAVTTHVAAEARRITSSSES